MAHLENLEVLVIESQQGMRAQLRSMLDGFMVTGVQFAPSAAAAVRKLRGRRFDLILCAYDLGDGQNGQHLLEDLRTHKVIPLDTLFIMISGERSYEKVVGTAELTPNDYILKPLTPGTLLMRLQRAVAKRDVFLPAYRMMEAGETQTAIDYCLVGERDHPAYRIDFMRLRAELHEAQGQPEQAEAIYRAVLELRAVPWARLGVARMLFAGKRYEDAERLLMTLVSEHSFYLDAYDWLARTREALERPQQAREALASAVELSPDRMSRLRHLGEVSIAAGDYAGAEKVLSDLVRKCKYSDFRDPEDHLRLLRAHLIQQKFDDAQATVSDLEKSMIGRPSATVCGPLARALLHQCTGNREAAREALQQAVRASRKGTLPTSLKHELIKACLDNALEAEGSELVVDVLRNAADQQTIEQTRALLRARGREDLTERIEERLYVEVKSYVTAGAEKAQAGDYDGAVAEMMNAVRKMPGNPHVLFNAALALLRRMEHNGWNERFAAEARNLINRTRKLDPQNPRLDAITRFMANLATRFGMDRNAVKRGSKERRAAASTPGAGR
ncbi:tetratricopeptide repeat protein [Rhodocyclaceae bacterium SMB388]